MLLFARENTLDLNFWTGADPYSVRAVCGKTQRLPANVAFVSSVSMVIGARRGRGNGGKRLHLSFSKACTASEYEVRMSTLGK